MKPRFRLFLAGIFALSLLSQSAFAESPTPAFASPDARQVPKGYWQDFFIPNFLLPLSFIANSTNTFSSVLPPCDGKQDACIKSVEYQLNGGEWHSASPGADMGQRDIAFGNLNPDGTWNKTYTSTFPENIADGLPQGSTARLWKFDHAPHFAGSEYQISARVQGSKNPQTNKYQMYSFEVQAIPVTQSSTTFEYSCPQPSIFQNLNYGKIEGLCTTRYDFPENLQLRVVIKLGTFLRELQGWFDGRLRNAQIEISELKQEVSIQGMPIRVPSASNAPMKYEEIPSDFPGWRYDQLIINSQNSGNTGWANFETVNDDTGLSVFIRMGDSIQKNAIGENTIWKVSSMPNSTQGQCFQKGEVSGVVLTNSTVYSAKPPTWNSDDSSLNFRVGAPHFRPNGDLFKGYYKLLVSEKAANCYWGDRYAKGTASISVTNQDGNTDIATTNLGLQNGWVNFEAAGFTFSSPTISAKIKLPEEPKQPEPVVQKESISPEIKLKTITCISAKKVVKKITSASPVCPKGFKKR